MAWDERTSMYSKIFLERRSGEQRNVVEGSVADSEAVTVDHLHLSQNVIDA